MTRTEQFEEVRVIAEAMCEGEATAEQKEELKISRIASQSWIRR